MQKGPPGVAIVSTVGAVMTANRVSPEGGVLLRLNFPLKVQVEARRRPDAAAFLRHVLIVELETCGHPAPGNSGSGSTCAHGAELVTLERSCLGFLVDRSCPDIGTDFNLQRAVQGGLSAKTF